MIILHGDINHILIEPGEIDLEEEFNKLKRVINWDYDTLFLSMQLLDEKLNTVSKGIDEIKEAIVNTK